MSIEETGDSKLERHLQEDFDGLDSEMQSYFMAEALSPEILFEGGYESESTNKKIVRINEAEAYVTRKCLLNDDLSKAQLYLESVATYLLDGVNSRVEEVFVG